jgi:mRNA-degrading endonuclease RelE of RelBE toxin-antitoxin system
VKSTSIEMKATESRNTKPPDRKRQGGYRDLRSAIVLSQRVLTHLKYDAEVRSRRKKPFEENPLAPWELRIGRFRVFYTIEAGKTVKVVAVGHKEHNELFIRGGKVQL